MSNPYAGTWSASGTLSNVKGSGGAGGRDLVLEPSSLTTMQLIGRILSYARPHALALAVSFVCAATSVVLQLFVPILVGCAIDLMLGMHAVSFEALRSLLVQLALCVAGAAGTQWLSLYCSNRVAYLTARDLRNAAYGKFRTLALSFVDTHAHGDLLSRVVNDVDAVGDGLLQGFNQLLSGIITIVGTIVFMCTLSVPVALVVVVLTPLSIFAARWIASHSSSSFAAQQKIQGELSGYAEEAIGNQALLSAFGRQQAASDAFGGLNQELYGAGEHAQFVGSLTNPSTRLVNNITYAIIAVVGCACVIGGWPSVLTVGQVQSFLSYTNQYMKPFNEITAVVGQVQTAFASARRVFALLDAEQEAPDSQDAMAPAQPRGTIDIKGAWFSYDKKHKLLQDVNLHVGAGQRFALVGPTGCGKTTLINLLLRFYEVDQGSIELDGIDVKRMTRYGLRSMFGMVLQDTWLFEGTIADNIRYAKPDATDEEVVRAARLAHAHKFIEQLAQGYQTVVGPGGGQLSAGQRQLLCIARVMLADPAILLLDEATSSIDTRTERQVQDAFDRMMEGRTSLVVAHRLSTIKSADCIVVMNAGKIVETGTHDELLAAHGAYAELYQSQFAH